MGKFTNKPGSPSFLSQKATCPTVSSTQSDQRWWHPHPPLKEGHVPESYQLPGPGRLYLSIFQMPIYHRSCKTEQTGTEQAQGRWASGQPSASCSSTKVSSDPEAREHCLHLGPMQMSFIPVQEAICMSSLRDSTTSSFLKPGPRASAVRRVQAHVEQQLRPLVGVKAPTNPYSL